MTQSNLAYADRGGNYMTGHAGLAIHGTNKDNALTANATQLVFDGVTEALAADTEVTTPAAVQQAVLTTCMYIMCVVAGGAVTWVKGTEQLTADLTAGRKMLEWPIPTAESVVVGSVKVVLASTATFTLGTTAFDATNVTSTFKSHNGRLPAAGP